MNFVKILRMRIRNLRFSTTEPEKDRVQTLLDQLHYDFNHFQLDHFIDHIAAQRRKPIVCLAMPLDPTLFGVWISGSGQEYIFYNAFVQPIHQVHIVLHEIGHMLLDHQKRPIASILPPQMIAQLNMQGLAGRARFAPSDGVHEDVEEQESERFVYLVQRYTMCANRLTELTGESSSIERLKPITDTMGYTRS